MTQMTQTAETSFPGTQQAVSLSAWLNSMIRAGASFKVEKVDEKIPHG
jgi:hypothetical protein